MRGGGEGHGRRICMNRAEAERIRRVYAEYDADERVQRRWDPSNLGNAANRAALKRQIATMLPDLSHHRILEIGCGTGDVLALLAELGAAEDQLTGLDLREHVVATAQSRFPTAKFVLANAEELPLPDAVFDVVALFTVLSSVQAPESRKAIANEAARVLRRGGMILWYDIRFPNPWNRNVRAINRLELQDLFPDFQPQLRSATLIPQLARRLGPLTGFAFPVLHALPFLRSHWLAVLRKSATS
jgi:ubiquinone/menaquinone biosynthesis C-methylase UbiE